LNSNLTFNEIQKRKPKRFEIKPNGKVVFYDLTDREKAELLCDRCGKAIWDSLPVGEKNNFGFLLSCRHCDMKLLIAFKSEQTQPL